MNKLLIILMGIIFLFFTGCVKKAISDKKEQKIMSSLKDIKSLIIKEKSRSMF